LNNPEKKTPGIYKNVDDYLEIVESLEESE